MRPSVEVGDLLCVHEALSGLSNSYNYVADPPGWCIVTACDDDGSDIYVHWFRPAVDMEKVPYLNRIDDFEVASPDDVPDDVLAEYTRMRLMGELE